MTSPTAPAPLPTPAQLVQPFAALIDLSEGAMPDFTRRTERRASSMRGHYADAAALEQLVAAGDPIHYEVFDVEIPTSGPAFDEISRIAASVR